MLNLYKTDMWKDFCQSLRKRINVDRRLGYRKKGELVVWYQSNGDFLEIFRDAPNSYVIHFDSEVREHSWKHEDVPLRLVKVAVSSFDDGTDMLGNSFHNVEEHTFEY